MSLLKSIEAWYFLNEHFLDTYFLSMCDFMIYQKSFTTIMKHNGHFLVLVI